MSKFWKYYASHSLWSQFSPAIGQEHCHCDRKRGYQRARKKEPAIKPLATMDNMAQKIGHLAQRGVYEFHHNVQLLSEPNGVEKVAQILQLENESPEIQARINFILNNYYQQPILLDKNILALNRGDESFPEAVPIKYSDFTFGLYAVFDCVLLEADDKIHIVDFKTGKSNFDRRQAYVYLLAAKYLYPEQQAIASFYNLETQVLSEPLNATPEAIKSVSIELSLVAQKHQQDLQRYKNDPTLFDRIFPANSGLPCKYCAFNSVCEYAVS
jgi:hypothetical protein